MIIHYNKENKSYRNYKIMIAFLFEIRKALLSQFFSLQSLNESDVSIAFKRIWLLISDRNRYNSKEDSKEA